MESRKSNIPTLDKRKLELLNSLIREFPTIDPTVYSNQELTVITLFFHRYSKIKEMMSDHLKEAGKTNIYLESVQLDFNYFKSLTPEKRKILNDFGLNLVKKELKSFIKMHTDKRE